MPHSLLRKIGKSDIDLRPHNIALSNYEGKTLHSLCAIHVNLAVGSVIRPTLFIVVPSKANFNFLLRTKWIHEIGVVPSSLHQIITTWRKDRLVENIEACQNYFTAEVNHITKRSFDKIWLT